MKLNYKLWLENDAGERVMGKGLLDLLTLIDKTGSINRAANELEMSYRAAWGKLNKAEKELGYDLVTKKSGGKGGGGSTLTNEGRDLLTKFRKLDRGVSNELEELFNEVFL